MKLLSGVGEKWTFAIHPAELQSYLNERGLNPEVDFSAPRYRWQYFNKNSLKMKGYEFYRVALAAGRRGNTL